MIYFHIKRIAFNVYHSIVDFSWITYLSVWLFGQEQFKFITEMLEEKDRFDFDNLLFVIVSKIFLFQIEIKNFFRRDFNNRNIINCF